MKFVYLACPIHGTKLHVSVWVSGLCCLSCPNSKPTAKNQQTNVSGRAHTGRRTSLTCLLWRVIFRQGVRHYVKSPSRTGSCLGAVLLASKGGSLLVQALLLWVWVLCFEKGVSRHQRKSVAFGVVRVITALVLRELSWL